MDIETQLGAALYGQVASTLPEQDRMTKIRVRYPDRVRLDKERLGQLPISLAGAAPGGTQPPPGAAGSTAASIGFVPLEQLAAIELVRSPNELWRENQQPVITVSAELGGSDLGSVNRELEARLGELHFPPGYRWELAGEHRAQQESFRSLLGVMLLAAALVFLLLGFQFHSLTLPLLIFLAQPVSLATRCLPLDYRHAAECLFVHGCDFADRAGRQERHHPDRVHRPVARGRHAAGRCPGPGRAGPLPPDPDDQPDHDFRPGAVGPGLGPGRRCSSRWPWP